MNIEGEKSVEIQTFPAETLTNTSPEFLGEEAIAKIWDSFGDFQQKGAEQLRKLVLLARTVNGFAHEIEHIPLRVLDAIKLRGEQLAKRTVHNIENLMHEPVTKIQPGEEVETEISIENLRKLPKAERPEALRVLKEKHQKQMIGLAKIQTAATERIRKNPDISEEELLAEVTTAGENIGMNTVQREIAKKAVEKYCEKHEAVKTYREKYPNDFDLFIALTNRPPVGKVEIITGPMTFMIRCHNIDDYALIVDGVFLQDSGAETHPSKLALRSGGISTSAARQPELKGTIIGEKASWNPLGRYSQDSMRLLEHEQQHAFFGLLREAAQDVQNEKNIAKMAKRTDAEKESDLKQYIESRKKIEELEVSELFPLFLSEERFFGEYRAANEILAYTREGGRDPYSIQSILFQPEENGGLYDYFAKIRIPEVAKKHNESPETMQEMKERYITKPYRAHVLRGIESVEQLKNKGYTEQEIVGFLTFKPLDTWPKEVKRAFERV